MLEMRALMVAERHWMLHNGILCNNWYAASLDRIDFSSMIDNTMCKASSLRMNDRIDFWCWWLSFITESTEFCVEVALEACDELSDITNDDDAPEPSEEEEEEEDKEERSEGRVER